MNIRKILCSIFFIIILTGCASFSSDTENNQADAWNEDGYINVGDILTVNKSDSRLTLLDNKDTLASDGLFYCSWTIGDAIPYENSEGDTIDLYDAQLYLLLGEFVSAAKAEENMDDWLATAKVNYDVVSEENIDLDGQTYTIITYGYINENNPYARGASAFGLYESNAVCIELSCSSDFDDEPKDILIDFLNNCTYNAK
ncbi:MAG: hypothetical protein NC433_13450 [Clostridiales bacterium]|nr:hypothetical protein [Clostridiales bacterium]